MIGLWAIGEYAVDLQRKVFETYFTENATSPLSPAGVERPKSTNAISLAYILNMLGAGVGMWIFTKLAQWYGRRPAFAIGYSAALVTTLLVYWKMNSPWDAYWMMPLMGAAQLSVFAGFRDLFAGAVSQPVAQHGHVVLLQPRPVCRRGRQLLFRQAGDGRLRPLRLAAEGALLGHDDVRDLPRRPGDAAVRAGDEGQAVAGVGAEAATGATEMPSERAEHDSTNRSPAPSP